MQYYHDIITERSFQFLQEFKKDFNFILIGGWAVYLFTCALKSKDIDIIVDYEELAKLKEKYGVSKNDRLKKYEIKTGEFDVDIYLPHYSDLGIDIEEIKNSSMSKKGFIVPALEILLMLKLYAWKERRGSAKGQKDEMDILSLAVLREFNWQKFNGLVSKLKFGNYKDLLKNLLEKTIRIKEFGLNDQKFSKIKKGILAQI